MTEKKLPEQGKYWHKFWTVPNAFTLLRIGSSCAIVAYLALNGLAPLTLFQTTSSLWLPLWTTLTATSDFIDGTLARTLHQQSKWGQALDPVADKILNWGIGLSLIATGTMPLWVLTIAARDVAVGLFTGKKKFQDGKKRNQGKQPEKTTKGVDKIKKIYHTFALGEAPSPTYPAKMKMALQSVGVVATLAFGFQTISLAMGIGVMLGSVASMTIPEKFPISKKIKQIIELFGVTATTVIASVIGGASLIAPVMMSSAISMVVPEIFAIKKEYLTPKNKEKKSEVQPKEQPLVLDIENSETIKENQKHISKTSTHSIHSNVDYSIIDRMIEEEMLKENGCAIEKEKPKQYTKLR